VSWNFSFRDDILPEAIWRGFKLYVEEKNKNTPAIVCNHSLETVDRFYKCC
jgi:hypothetical protein